MNITTLGILLGIAGIVLTVIFGLGSLRSRSVTHWTSPTWTTGTQKKGNSLVPVLSVRWAVRGSDTSIQGVECSVRGPSGKWHQLAFPKGRLDLPNENLYTYINLVDEKPFNTVVASPSDIGKQVKNIVAPTKKGHYRLRIRWYENEKPKPHEKIFSHKVT